jgi:hypothetical protein
MPGSDVRLSVLRFAVTYTTPEESRSSMEERVRVATHSIVTKSRDVTLMACEVISEENGSQSV